MSINPTLLSLFQQLMSSYDSNIDTTTSSTFYSSVILPLLTRIGADPLDGDIEAFLAQYLTEQMPTLDSSKYSGIRDLVIRPLALMIEPIRREIISTRNGLSFTNAQSMTEEELNLLLANFFLSKNAGTKATGVVRVYFSSPTNVTITPAITFSTSGGLGFNPTQTTSITDLLMGFNVDASNGLYFFDVSVEAEIAGSAYNVAAGQIQNVSGIPAAVSCTNINSVSSLGSDSETNQEAVTRALNSITVQNLVTKSGIDVVLKSNFSSITDLKVIGAGETEMLRDIVEGPTTISGVPGGFKAGGSFSVPAGGIHVGGKTDVYLHSESAAASASEVLEIENITDTGDFLYTSQTGYVTVAGTNAGASQILYDLNGNFSTSVHGSGYVYYKQYIYIIDPSSSGVTSTSVKVHLGASAYTTRNMTQPPPIPYPSTGIFFEIRKPSMDARVRVTLDDLAAVNPTTGALEVGSTTKCVVPIPGDFNLAGLTDTAGAFVEKTENIIKSPASSSNIKLPLFRGTSVSLNAGGTSAGDLAWGEVVGFSVVDMSLDTTTYSHANYARGTLRVYLKDQANITAIPAFTGTQNGGGKSYTGASDPQIILERRYNHLSTSDDEVVLGPVLEYGAFKYGVEPITFSTITSSVEGPFDGVTVSNRITVYVARTSSIASSDADSTGVGLVGDYIYIRRNSADGSKTYLTSHSPNIWPPKPGMFVHVMHDAGATTSNSTFLDSTRSKWHKIETVTEVTGTGGSSGAIPFYKVRLRKGNDNTGPVISVPSSITTDVGFQIFLYQGVSAQDLLFDSVRRLYYADFKIFCLDSNSSNAVIPANTTTLKRFSPVSSPYADFYVEGWSLRSNNKGHGYSTREEPLFMLTDFVTATAAVSGSTPKSYGPLVDKTVSWTITLNYEHLQESFGAVQTFVESDTNRIVAEDTLIKHFLPSIPFFSISATGLTATTGLNLVKSFVNSIPSSKTFEISDLISYLYNNGATYVELPIKVSILKFDQNRVPTMEHTETASTLSSIERFYAIEDGIFFTVIT